MRLKLPERKSDPSFHNSLICRNVFSSIHPNQRNLILLISGLDTPLEKHSGLLDHQDNNDTAVIIYTSGTTGRPKGAEITHGNLTSNLQSLHEIWGWQSDDVLLHVLPIFHVHGLFVALHGALYAGATTLLMREFNAHKTLELLSSGQCTVFMAVPTIHRRLLDVPDAKNFDLSHVRLITSGSDRLPDDLFTGFQKTFGYTLLERYGMTETGMNCSNPLHGERRIGSVGHPLPGVELRIVHSETGEILSDGEIGEVQLRGPNVFKGYWRQPDKTSASFSADGWFKTGDLGFIEKDGYVTLCGRSKDLIISGGPQHLPARSGARPRRTSRSQCLRGDRLSRRGVGREGHSGGGAQ